MFNFTSNKNSMSFQYTYDASGKPIGVFVPINEWEKLTTELKKSKSQNKKSRILKSVEKGMSQVKQIEAGKLKSISLKQLLDVL
jgi:YD repeat-containing protein